MAKFKIGVLIESMGLPFWEGVAKAKELGVEGIQFFTVTGEMDPENLDAEKRQELKKRIADHGLEIASTCGHIDMKGFITEEGNKWKVPKTKKILELATDLGTDIVTGHIGHLDPEADPAGWDAARKAMEEIGEHGKKVGALFAEETGPEPPEVLREFIESCDTDGLKVNYDPANLVMVAGVDPVPGVKVLAPYIVHTHAKDGLRRGTWGVGEFFEALEHVGDTPIAWGDYFAEVPLGQGNVGFPAWIAALSEIGFNGYLTIEREVGEDPVSDIKGGIEFLRQFQ